MGQGVEESSYWADWRGSEVDHIGLAGEGIGMGRDGTEGTGRAPRVRCSYIELTGEEGWKGYIGLREQR